METLIHKLNTKIDKPTWWEKMYIHVNTKLRNDKLRKKGYKMEYVTYIWEICIDIKTKSERVRERQTTRTPLPRGVEETNRVIK